MVVAAALVWLADGDGATVGAGAAEAWLGWALGECPVTDAEGWAVADSAGLAAGAPGAAFGAAPSAAGLGLGASRWCAAASATLPTPVFVIALRTMGADSAAVSLAGSASACWLVNP